ncbi:hypothetical protein BDAP_002898 [Binucleata daphniae]
MATLDRKNIGNHAVIYYSNSGGVDIHDQIILLEDDVHNKSIKQNVVGCLFGFWNFISSLDKTYFLYGMCLFNIALYTYFLYSGIIFTNNLQYTMISYIASIFGIALTFIHENCAENYNCFLSCCYLVSLAISTFVLLIINCYLFNLWILQFTFIGNQ